MRRNFIKILDNINTGLLTLNKVIHANQNFSGVNFNSFIQEKPKNNNNNDIGK